MWILKLKIKHNCTMATRCAKFDCTCYSWPIGKWTEKNFSYTSERHTLEGNEENIKKLIKDSKIHKELKDRTPANRLAEPEEIARAVVFIAAEGDYITGQQINVNGGVYM